MATYTRELSCSPMGWRFVLFYTYFWEGKFTDSVPDIARFRVLYLSPELNMRAPVVVHLPVVLRQPFFELRFLYEIFYPEVNTQSRS